MTVCKRQKLCHLHQQSRLIKSLQGFPDSWVGKESACNAGVPGSIPRLGRSPGEGKGYPLQYSGLENSMDCIVHGVEKSHTQLSDFHFHFKESTLKSLLESCLVAKSSLIPCDPVDCSPPSCSVHGISQVRILEWVAIPFSRGSSWLRDPTPHLLLCRQILYHWATKEA